MRIEPFDLERWQSIHEHTVEINLTESGVHPLRVRELIEPSGLEDLLEQELAYTQTNGTEALRARIAASMKGPVTPKSWLLMAVLRPTSSAAGVYSNPATRW